MVKFLEMRLVRANRLSKGRCGDPKINIVRETMKNKFIKTVLALCFACLAFVFAFAPLPKTELPASASGSSYISIDEYDVEMTISKDRSVRVHERITVTFLRSGLTMFYRSLPIETARYYDISASCAGNEYFRYTVEDNPDTDDFFDINCIGGVTKNAKWTYDVYYTMENGRGAATSSDGMKIDVIPFGYTTELHNVSATVHFPYEVELEDCKTYVGYGSTSNDNSLNKKLSNDKKTLTFSTDLLDYVYVSKYDEFATEGITLDFTMDGRFEPYLFTRLFTGGSGLILLGGLVVAGLAFVCLTFMRKHRDMITTVNLKAPDDMTPMQMGKLLDGTVDNEDVTSMVYYFAHRGYLSIDLSNPDDPVLIKRVGAISGAPYEITLFNGLFKSGSAVRVCDLQYKFYAHVDRAKAQVAPVKMFEKRSVLGYLLGGVLCVAFAFLSAFLLGFFRLGTTYKYMLGVAFALPAIVMLVLGYIRECYRYKGKKDKNGKGYLIAQIVIALVFSLIFCLFFAQHFTTEFEKILICVFAFAPLFITRNILSRTEEYTNTLGEILGFKDFILVTEEDKIKFMLEENPQLYYKVLPYAQVLGVTDEWEKKFENILLPPPAWSTGTHVSTFDCYVMHRAISRSMASAMVRPQPKGGSVGKSGGGGSFGGFGGGGFGGGGGGAR